MEWITENASIIEVEHDYDLKGYQVYNTNENEFVGTIIPENIQDMALIVNELNNGCCPIVDGWEVNY